MGSRASASGLWTLSIVCWRSVSPGSSSIPLSTCGRTICERSTIDCRTLVPPMARVLHPGPDPSFVTICPTINRALNRTSAGRRMRSWEC
uniref:Putative secreted protein n=1 Tax=Anopheles triannulatus TaxID=58253 RepID=A0A2M4B6S8_9DIPT